MIKAKEDTFHLGVKALIRNPDKEILLLERNPNLTKITGTFLEVVFKRVNLYCKP